MENRATSMMAYVGQLSRHLSAAMPRTLRSDGVEAVHQARVTTRRLGAALDLLRPWMTKGDHKKIDQSLRQLRKTLGPLRDLDVMLAGLEKYRPEHTAAVHWLETRLLDQRAKARKQLRRGSSLTAIDQWLKPTVGQKLQASQMRFNGMLSRLIRTRFDNFSRSADALAIRQPNLDVHDLRISGKKTRYSLEIAAATGAPLPKEILAQFKRIQDALGDWHDCVVLAQRTMKLAVKRELALHDPAMLESVLKLINAMTDDATAGIAAFIAAWTESRQEITDAIAQLYRADARLRKKAG
jgi:CHAD domain-containing protein